MPVSQTTVTQLIAGGSWREGCRKRPTNKETVNSPHSQKGEVAVKQLKRHKFMQKAGAMEGAQSFSTRYISESFVFS